MAKTQRRTRGTGTVYQVQNGRDKGRYRKTLRVVDPFTGATVEKSFQAASRPAVEAKAAAWLKATDGQITLGKGTVNEVVAAYLDTVAMDARAGATEANTLDSYRGQAKRIESDPIGSMSVAKLTGEDVDAWVKRMLDGVGRDRKLALGSVRHTRYLLSWALDDAVKRKRFGVRHNVVKDSRPVPAPKPRIVPPSKDEVGRIMATAKAKGPLPYALVRTFFTLGLRRGELLGLRWDDIDWDNGTVHIQRQYKDNPGGPVVGALKTPQSNRWLPLPQQTYDALKALQAVQEPKSEWVFANKVGKILDPRNLSRSLGGLGFNPHAARHFVGTLLDEKGEAAVRIRDYLGHKDIQTTLNFYVHPHPDSLKSSAGIVTSAFEAIDRANDSAESI